MQAPETSASTAFRWIGRRLPYLAEPSTKSAASLLSAWGKSGPTVVVATEDELNLVKSFRNLERVIVTTPAELEVAEVVWARSLLVSEAALPLVQGRAS